MNLRRRDVLQYLPHVKTLAKEAAVKKKEGERLLSDSARSRDIANALKGVVLHEDFPVRVNHYGEGTEVLSACAEVKRSAFVASVGSNKYVVRTYKNDGTSPDSDGTPLAGEHGKSVALKLAKDYVATGKKAGQTNGRVRSK